MHIFLLFYTVYLSLDLESMLDGTVADDVIVPSWRYVATAMIQCRTVSNLGMVELRDYVRAQFCA